MSTPKHYRTRATTRGTRTPTAQLGIRRFLRDRQEPSPGAIVFAPRAAGSERSLNMSQVFPPTTLMDADSPMGIPAAFRTGPAVPSQSQTRLDDDLHAMLQALPTRADIEALIQRVEEAHSRDMQEIKSELHTITQRVSTGENLSSALESRVLTLEQAHESHNMEIQEMQLHIEEMEDHSSRNNLWGIPEATGPEDLAETVTAIIHRLLGTPPPSLEIDRVH